MEDLPLDKLPFGAGHHACVYRTSVRLELSIQLDKPNGLLVRLELFHTNRPTFVLCFYSNMHRSGDNYFIMSLYIIYGTRFTEDVVLGGMVWIVVGQSTSGSLHM